MRWLPSTVANAPPESTYYLTAADLVRCHAVALEIAESTARHHLLHRSGLLAALDRPRWYAHYQNADLIDQAAVLGEGLVASHAWVDGNKRTTWVAVRTFLDLNGLNWRYPPSVAESVVAMTRLTTRKDSAADFGRRLRRYIA
jgi:death-on-curing family protein